MTTAQLSQEAHANGVQVFDEYEVIENGLQPDVVAAKPVDGAFEPDV